MIDPAFDSEVVVPNLSREKIALPSVIARQLQGRAPPNLLLSIAIEEIRRDGIVTVGEDICLDNHDISGDAFGRNCAAVNFGANGFYHNANPPVS
jgi:hypothetical protein